MDEAKVRQTVQRVLSILEDLDVPPELRATAFDHIWIALGATVAPARSPLPEEQHAAEEAGEMPQPHADLAAKLGVEPEAVATVFEPCGDGSFRVIIPTRDVPRENKPEATIQLALLVFAGRQLSLEAETSGAVIREVCSDYGVDRGKFARTMAARDDLWSIAGRGKGSPNLYKLRRTGWEEASKVVERLTSN